MSSNRIQKLLFTEYKDFEDMVLLESPFAQTTRDGRGIRQLQIGVTHNKLLLASDYLGEEDPRVKVDPEISTLELLSVLPVECVNMSIFKRKSRNTIKARFCNDQVLYFELASPTRRDMFWNLWRERVDFLAPDLSKSTQSEPSVGSSSSSSTHYRRNSKKCWLERDFKSHLLGHIKRNSKGKDITPLERSLLTKRAVRQVNRFGAGVDENCETNLFLSGNFLEPNKPVPSIFEEGVNVWEKSSHVDKKHTRRGGIAPFGLHLNGFGTVKFSKSEAVSTQMRKWSSETCIKDQNNPEFEFCVPKRQLISTLSFESLTGGNFKFNNLRTGLKYNYSQGPLMFWTTEKSISHKSAPKAFKELRTHIASIKHSISSGSKEKPYSIWSKKRRKKFIFFDKGGGGDGEKGSNVSKNKLSTSLLKMDITVTSWDFDSTTLSYQLTLIDRDLFVKIRQDELESMFYERNSQNAPNFNAMVKFAERITNLVATEIIRVDSVKLRARLMSKFVNVADKLHRLHNMHSTKSVLSGLQNPALYRLKKTWDYLKRHHSSKYRRLSTLLKIYREARSDLFGLLFEKFSRTMPYIPSLQYVIGGLLGHIKSTKGPKRTSSYPSICKTASGLLMENPWGTNSKLSELSESTANSSRVSMESGDNFARLDSCLEPLEAEYNNYLKLEAFKESFSVWQHAATGYEMIPSPLVKEFLLKRKYSEGYQLFEMSLKTE